MNEREQELFIELCKFKNPDKEKLKALLSENATPAVLGELFFNRMQGIAYGVLEQTQLLSETNREFRNSLKNAHFFNTLLNKDYFYCIELVSSILQEHKGKYAMLKGALLCGLYPDGYRTSNDIDLLVRPSDVTVIGASLDKSGFKQGYIRNGEFIPATRKEIIESKMMRGETVPYILEVNLPIMRYLEVDINFSLDYKNGESALVDSLLKRSVEQNSHKNTILTLNEYDYFIHLCCHLYKEATTLPWIKMKRDMSMYKFADIYMLLSNFGHRKAERLMFRALELGVSDICSCVVSWTCDLFDIEDSALQKLSDTKLSHNPEILYEIIAPAENKKYCYEEKNIKKRFFHRNRILLLEEVGFSAKT